MKTENPHNLPWNCEVPPSSSRAIRYIIDDKGNIVLETNLSFKESGLSIHEVVANSKFIVKAANSHEDLARILGDLVEYINARDEFLTPGLAKLISKAEQILKKIE